MFDSAKIILKSLGKEDSLFISVEDTSDMEKIFAGSKFNGDGIITEDSTDDDNLKILINEIVTYSGSAMDRGGKVGITAEIINAFMDNCEKFATWYARSVWIS